MVDGTVKFFNHARGFGFITGDDGKDYFVHATGLVQTVEQNDKVSFDIIASDRGAKAGRVVKRHDA
jgi:cold shock protein